MLLLVTPQLKSIYWVVSEKFSYNYIQMNVWKTVGIYWMITVEIDDVFWSSRGKTSIFFYYLLCLQGDACPKPPAANQPSFRPTSSSALIICCEVLLNVASTNFTTQRVETASRRTVIWNVSLVLHRHWWCHGVLVIAGLLLLPNFLSSIIPQWTRTPKTGIFTA